MKLAVQKHVEIENTVRAMQVSGMFDIPPSKRSEVAFEVDMPIETRDWNVGLIVGPSGSGKTTIAREAFSGNIVSGFDWPETKPIVDGFPQNMSMRDITTLLSSVGFSSPPAWLRPFRVLSNGEQFRATVARAMAESPQLAVIDEFTSVVDRTVAKVASAAIEKAVRRGQRKLIAVACHYDILDWLRPDWVVDTLDMRFAWRDLQRPRPKLDVEIIRSDSKAWRVFRHHHYLSADLNKAAGVFVALVEQRPAAFCAVLPFPHSYRPGWRMHRTVCLPDFQGIGLGNFLNETVCSMYRATGKPFFSTTSHPAMVRHRAKSPLWLMKNGMKTQGVSNRSARLGNSYKKNGSYERMTASFEYVGPPNFELAKGFGILK